MNSSFFDYFLFILIALGVIALGANDLYEKHGGKLKIAEMNKNGTRKNGKKVLSQLLEDRSAHFNRGSIPQSVNTRLSNRPNRQRAQYRWGNSELDKITDVLINDPSKDFDRKK